MTAANNNHGESLSAVVEKIQEFMAGNDLSYNRHLQSLLLSYTGFCKDLAKDLAQCRAVLKMQGLSEARHFAGQKKPPLTERAARLDFPERQEFLDLCRSYNLDLPPAPDRELLQLLQSEISPHERQLQEIMREWRVAAGKKEHPERKIRLLRQIIRLTPPEKAGEWQEMQRNLEKCRDQELLAALPQLPPGEAALPLLEKTLRELLTPERLTTPLPELLTEVKNKLRPLQEARLTRQKQEMLDRINEYAQSRDFDHLRSELQQWQALKTHPLLKLTELELQTEKEAVSMLELEDRAVADKKRFEELIADLKASFAAGEPYARQAKIYNELQLLELPLSDELTADMEQRREEYERDEHRKNVRRGIYAVSAAALLLIAGIIILQFTEHRRAVRTICAEYNTLIESGDYATVLNKFAELRQTAPKLAADASVRAAADEAESRQKQQEAERNRAAAEYRNLASRLQKLLEDKLADSAEALKIREQLEKLQPLLAEEDLDALHRLKSAAEMQQRQLQEERVADFRRRAAGLETELEQWKQALPATELESAEAELNRICRQRKELAAGADAVVQEQAGKLAAVVWQQKSSEAEHLLRRERELRAFRKLLDCPENAEEFLNALEQVRSRQPQLAALYTRALEEAYCDRMRRTLLAVHFLGVSSPDALLKGTEKADPAIDLTPPGQVLKFCAAAGDNNFDAVKFINDLLKNVDYYELSLKDEQGAERLFYTREKPKTFRPRENQETVKGIKFEAVLQNGRTPTGMQLAITADTEDRVIYRLRFPAGKIPGLESPAAFTEFSGIDLKSGECRRNPVYLLIMKHRLDTAPEQREMLLRQLLQEAAAEKMSNGDLQLFFIQKLLTELNKFSPIYAAVTAPKLAALQAQANSEGADFLLPRPRTMAPGETAAALRIPEMLRRHDDTVQFYRELLARHFEPAGVVDSQGKIHCFAARQPAELLVVTGNRSIRLLNTEPASGKIAPEDRELLWPGQLLWHFADGRKSRDFFTPERAGKILRDRRPALWPENLYFPVGR